MSDFISYLFAIFVVTPLQAELSDRLPTPELMDAARTCITSEGPRLLQMAQDNWGWAAANGLGVAFGMVDPVTLLSNEDENCRLVRVALENKDSADA
ncbi:hypothetical protein [Neorhizobium sp. JUb45]|uniref:hypothetical protein n=1 Tax=unclassified Neorhizobium TaxID=2629175 RepID=UPI001052B4CE|nr:hypothetical protein [Neorhizobium sp. JUb45]TCR04533.1 hypothetical protein EDF70_102632 [Neorhizobium sp. JUb45]